MSPRKKDVEYTEEEEQAKCREIRDRWDEAFKFWDPIYKAGQANLKAIAGDPWNATDREAREQAGRPVVTFDELGQYVNHAINDVRANPVAVKFSPTDEVASDDTAKFYGGRMRECEYRSNAQTAYTKAFENALQFNSGYVRLRTEYAHPKSFNQQVVIEPIPRADSVYPDPDGLIRPDGSAWRYLFQVHGYSDDEFERIFPTAKKRGDFTTEQVALASKWMSAGGKIQVAEYWEIETKDYEVVMVLLPATRTRDEQVVTYIEGIDEKPRARGMIELDRRPTQVDSVCSYFTNGLELLEKDGKKKHEWAGQYIPFASCYGKIVYINNGSGPEPVILSLVSLALSPYMAYCFAAACELEAVGTITKNPYFAYEGSLDPAQKAAIKSSLHQPVAVLESKAKIEGLPGVLIPLPQRNPMSVDLSAYAIVKEGARRAVQAAMGLSPLPTSMQKNNPKLSGTAMERFEESGQKGSYHFKDGYYDMIRRVGVIFEDLEDRIEDTERLVNVRGADNQSQKMWINSQREPEDGMDVLRSNKGSHAVTIDIGPEFASERRESAAFLDTFLTSPAAQRLEPAKYDKLLSLAIKERVQGAMGEKMADVISPQEQGEDNPDQLKALLKQAQEQIIPAYKAQIAELQAKLDGKVAETQGKLVVQQQADQTKLQIAEMQTAQKTEDTTIDARTALEIAKLRAEIDVMKMELQKEIEGAKLAQQTAMAERGHEEGAAEAQAQRSATSAESEKSRRAAAREGDANRQAAERQAAMKPKAKG